MIIILDNTNHDLLDMALCNHFINLNATILYKNIENNMLIEVLPIRLNPLYADFDLDKFKDIFKPFILYIDYRANLMQEKTPS